jgi:hypothetical protein
MDDPTEVERQAAAFRKLINNPEVGLEAKRLYKKVVPDARFPDLDAEERLAAATKPLQEKIDKMESEQLDERVRRNRETNHKKVRDAGLDPDAVEKIMTDEKIMNYDTAIKYMKAQTSNSQPSHSSITPITMPTDAKEIQKNPGAWARGEASKAINDLINNRKNL